MGLFKKSKRDNPAAALAANRKREMKGKKSAPRPGRRRALFGAVRLRGWMRGLLRLCFALAVTGLVILAGAAAYRHATTSEYFAFKVAEISGGKRLGDAEILDAAGLVRGQNIFSVDMAQARRALMNHPWIAEAEVARQLPGSLRIAIVERRAKVMVNFDVLYLVDDTGKVFKRWKWGDPIPAPVITGIAREEFVESSEAVEDILRDAIDLADRYRASGLEKVAALAEIHRETDGGFSLTVGDDPAYVRFGRPPYRNKLTRLAALFARLNQDGNTPAVIYFDNEIRPDRITVKLKKDDLAGVSPLIENSIPEMKKRVSKI
jgi:cell division protein FtsQ